MFISHLVNYTVRPVEMCFFFFQSRKCNIDGWVDVQTSELEQIQSNTKIVSGSLDIRHEYTRILSIQIYCKDDSGGVGSTERVETDFIKRFT